MDTIYNPTFTLLYLGFFLVSIATTMASTETEGHEGITELDNFIKHMLECRGVPGLAIAMVKDNRIVFARGYGHADLEHNVKVTKHSKFCIGSLTKAFTSTLFADILSKETNITWDTPIKHILGNGFRLSDSLRTDHVTIRDLLTHRVCTPSNFNALLVGFPSDVTREDLVRRLQHMPANCEFRGAFRYSNYMYMLAGHVAEVITGESWENMVASRILAKVGMNDSGFVDKLESLDDIATPYVHKNQRIVPVAKDLILTVSPSGPAGSIFSTATDMAHWMKFQLKHGVNIHGKQVIDPMYLRETYEPQMPQPFSAEDLLRPLYPVSDASVSYNMGWMTSIYRGYKKLWHSGGIVAFSSHLWMFPDAHAGVFVTINGPLNRNGQRTVRTISARAADVILGEKPWLNISTGCTFPSPWEDALEIEMASGETEYRWNSNNSMRVYTGVYGNVGFGSINVTIQNHSLVLTFGRFGRMRIAPENDTMFKGMFVDKLWYMTNSDGNTQPMKMLFEININSEVTGLLFPVDMNSFTLFTKKCSNVNDASDDRQERSYSYTCGCSGIGIVKAVQILLISTFVWTRNFMSEL